jgi:hypothetical protein
MLMALQKPHKQFVGYFKELAVKNPISDGFELGG